MWTNLPRFRNTVSKSASCNQMSCNEETIKFIGVLNELHDNLSALNAPEMIQSLPQIVVVGSQSAGKSSVLESFVGRDFLPRGSDIVTRRPLILQLKQNRDDSQIFAKFFHSSKIFTNFDEIRDEIEDETNRTVPDSSISSDPINLKITSPDVLDLNLVDLPGMTKVPVGNQPENIETIVRDLIISFISKDNCLILAVTPANQDLSTSDAIKLSREVDPEGKRTIGVLTKLDLMGAGTNARGILCNEHQIKLKRGFIGVMNRSQKDIDCKKDLRQAMADEKTFFAQHSAYKDISNKLGVEYLQKYLQTELERHLFKELPALKDRFEDEMIKIIEKIDNMEVPIKDMEPDVLISETIEKFRKRFTDEIGKGEDVAVHRLNGGAKISEKMNVEYTQNINQIFRDIKRIKEEIRICIKNSCGTRVHYYVPNKVFESVVRNQIELMRSPSLKCVDSVWKEVESIVKESVKEIGSFQKLIDLYSDNTLECVRECRKKCRERVEHKLETEKAYINTIHEDFIQEMKVKKSCVMIETDGSKSSWIRVNGEHIFFNLTKGVLHWFLDESKSNHLGSINVVTAHILSNEWPHLVLNDYRKQIKLEFETNSSAEEWKDLLETCQTSKLCDDSENQFNYETHIDRQIEEVMKLVLAYMPIVEKNFKDYMPKLCQKEMINVSEKFIGMTLRNRIQKKVDKQFIIDDLVDDPLEEENKQLNIKKTLYESALKTINKVLKPSLFN